MDKTKRYSIIYYSIMSAIVLGFMLYLQYQTAISFDGGMNFTVSRSLNLIGKYAADYHDITMFETRIQTGAPVIFPTAVLNFLFGINPANMQIVTTFLGACFAISICYMLGKKTNFIVSTIVTIFLVSFPSFLNVSYLAYGETSMGLFIFWTCVLYSNAEQKEDNKFFLASGICLGVSYLTKIIALIICPVLGLIMLVRLILKKGKIKKYLFFLLGACIPVIIFELYKLFQLGGHEYYAWWSHMFSAIMDQAGLTDTFTSNDQTGINKAILHIETLCSQYNINIVLLCVMFLVPVIVLVYKIVKKEKIDLLFLSSYGVFCIYFFWWTFMSPTSKLWPRRILVGMLMGFFVFSWALYLCIRYVVRRFTENKVWLCVILTCIYAFLFVFASVENVKCSIEENKRYKDSYIVMEEIVDYVKELPPDSKFYGVEWLQNPIISSHSGKQMRDISQETVSGDDCYYVQENMSSEWMRVTQNYVLAQYETELVFDNGGGRIYKLLGRKDENNTQYYISSELDSPANCTISFYGAAEGEGYSEDKRSTTHLHDEDSVVAEVFYTDIKQIMMVISYSESSTQILTLRNMKIKTDLGEMILYPEDIYNRIMDLEENKMTYLSYDADGNLCISVDSRRLFSINLR